MNHDQQAIADLKRALLPILPEAIFADLSKLASTDNEELPIFDQKEKTTIPLFKNFPLLSQSISYASLATLPTPITQYPNIANKLGVAELLMKRDDLTGKKINEETILFGGNKVRKLEFLLANAVAKKADAVMTFGCVGSNHALATAVYAKEVGLQSILMLLPQANSLVVQRNLLLDADAEATMIFAPTNKLRAISATHHFLAHKLEHGKFPYVIPTGGSCALGILGYVNAAFELKEQIDNHELKEPTTIYIPVGSCGTYVGLLLGLKAAGIKSKLIGISVEPEDQRAQLDKIKRLFEETNELLHNADSSFALFPFDENELNILHDFTGNGYALFTQEGIEAIKLLREKESDLLDGVYSGKAFAGLLSDVSRNGSQHDTILFWNTFCADDYTSATSRVSYKDLPSCFHEYFESKPLQDSLFH